MKMLMPCPNCGGMGVLFIMDNEQDCARCEGTGEIEVDADGR